MSFTPTWELLRSFGSSRFAKLSVFVPVFGYFIIFNDAFVALVGSSMEWACAAFQSVACGDDGFAKLDDDFMLRKVVNIYIALSAIGLSTLIFQGLCPHEVKKFWHVEDYVAENTKVFHHEFNRRIRGVLDKSSPGETLRIQKTFDRYKEHDRPKASEMYDRDVLALWFSYQNTRFEAARWTCFVLFSVGVALLTYPTVTVFLKVCAIILTR
ncbi:hypothetical protein J7426_22400 [Tropicibacter sp. R16_0]|uniref:hypothetical protein n=1 Tax=Tropicibacter sp. R16_0 TaxID=2821102 RepID=UPI001ADCC57E|nr:hypothetical protein [Tropicibacter sp. R16_0]MBO9453030.1 hypothetical protein [Tropicibacter sp. R16_0]